MFDGYETFALVLVANAALQQVLPADLRAAALGYQGIVIGVTLLGWACGGVLWGILADYFGRKPTMIQAILIYSVFTGLTFFAQSWEMLAILRFLTGLGLGAEWGTGVSLVVEKWPESTRAKAAACLQSGIAVGFFIASFAWFLLQNVGPDGWRYMFLVGVLPALLVLYIRRGVNDPELWQATARRREQARERARTGSVAQEDQALLRFTLGHIWESPELRRRLLVTGAMSTSTLIAWWAVSTWIPQYAGQFAGRAGLNPQQFATLAALVYNAGGILGYILFGVFADSFGRKPITLIYYLGSLPLVIGLFLLAQDPTMFLVLAAINGFFTLGQFSWMPIYLPELFPTPVRATALAVVFNISRYVAGFGPLVAGVLIAQLGGLAQAATLFGLIYVLGLVITPFSGPETRGQPLPE